jgi:hypothetical protein
MLTLRRYVPTVPHVPAICIVDKSLMSLSNLSYLHWSIRNTYPLPMSFTVPRIRKRKNDLRDSGPTSGPSLIRVEDLPRLRKPYGLPRIAARGLYREHQASFTQLFDPAERGLHHQPEASFNLYPISPSQEFILPSDDRQKEQAQAKKARQWRKWVDEVIPSLVRPYLAVLRHTDSFRLPVPPRTSCTCTSGSRRLNVVCVYFDSMLFVSPHILHLNALTGLDCTNVVVCHHASAAVQLVQLGLFPCAPVEPSLAVDMAVLQFASQLFMRSSPNVRAFADTIDVILSERQYKLTTRVGIHISHLCNI